MSLPHQGEEVPRRGQGVLCQLVSVPVFGGDPHRGGHRHWEAHSKSREHGDIKRPAASQGRGEFEEINAGRRAQDGMTA